MIHVDNKECKKKRKKKKKNKKGEEEAENNMDVYIYYLQEIYVVHSKLDQ